jgi:protein required for attachment to host cells
MRHSPKLIFLVADGAHARFVERSAETGHFVTSHRLDGEALLRSERVAQRGAASGRSFESASSARHKLGREGAYRRVKSAFARGVAETLAAFAAERAAAGVVLVAPSHTVTALREALPRGVSVVATLDKDLVKTPDHELGAWLDSLELQGSAALKPA